MPCLHVVLQNPQIRKWFAADVALEGPLTSVDANVTLNTHAFKMSDGNVLAHLQIFISFGGISALLALKRLLVRMR